MDERPLEGPDRVLPAPASVVGGRRPSLAARLDVWLADARIEGSADSRARERWLHQAAEADATVAGVLLDLAERRAAVSVHTSGARVHHGHIDVIGADFAALRTTGGAEVLVALTAITSVCTAPLVEPAVGERVVTTELRLIDVLAQLAAERERVLVVSPDGRDAIAGELRSVGHDVIRLRTEADPPATAYVPAASVATVTLS